MRCSAPGYVFAAALLTSSCGGDGTDKSTSQGSESGSNTPEASTQLADASVQFTDAGSLDLDAGSGEGEARDSSLPIAHDAGKDAEPPLVNEANAAQKLLGHYAMRQRSALTANALGMKLKSQATNYMLVDIVERAGQVVWSQRGCQSKVENDPASTTVSVADAVPRSTPALEVALLAKQDGYVIAWERVQASIALGFQDSDPKQAIPTDKADPRVYDQDGDGKPGITVHIRTNVLLQQIEGDTYNAQRLHSKLRGSFDGEKLTGESFESTETKVLEATHTALTFSPTPQRDAAGDNSVLLVKTTAGMTCDQLVEKIDQLF